MIEVWNVSNRDKSKHLKKKKKSKYLNVHLNNFSSTILYAISQVLNFFWGERARRFNLIIEWFCQVINTKSNLVTINNQKYLWWRPENEEVKLWFQHVLQQLGHPHPLDQHLELLPAVFAQQKWMKSNSINKTKQQYESATRYPDFNKQCYRIHII